MNWPAHCADRSPIVAAEVGDGLEVRRRRPISHISSIFAQLPAQGGGSTAAGSDSRKINLQQRRRGDRRGVLLLRDEHRQSQVIQIKLIDEDFDDRTGLSSVRNHQGFGSKNDCLRSSPRNETSHRQPSKSRPIQAISRAFFTQSGPMSVIWLAWPASLKRTCVECSISFIVAHGLLAGNSHVGA